MAVPMTDQIGLDLLRAIGVPDDVPVVGVTVFIRPDELVRVTVETALPLERAAAVGRLLSARLAALQVDVLPAGYPPP